MSNEYKVGYKKPPLHSQFKKGQSGYPADRPRKRKVKPPDVRSAVNDALNAPMAVNENGKRRQLTGLQVFFRQLVNKAATGNAAQQRILFQVLMKLVDLDHANELNDAEAVRRSTEDLKRELDAIFLTELDDTEDEREGNEGGGAASGETPETPNGVTNKESSAQGEEE